MGLAWLMVHRHLKVTVATASCGGSAHKPAAPCMGWSCHCEEALACSWCLESQCLYRCDHSLNLALLVVTLFAEQYREVPGTESQARGSPTRNKIGRYRERPPLAYSGPRDNEDVRVRVDADAARCSIPSYCSYHETVEFHGLMV